MEGEGEGNDGIFRGRPVSIVAVGRGRLSWLATNEFYIVLILFSLVFGFVNFLLSNFVDRILMLLWNFYRYSLVFIP